MRSPYLGVIVAVTLALAGCGLLEPDGDAPESARIDGLACRSVEVPPGPEDLVIDRARGLAYVASTDRRSIEAGGPGPVGFISRLDLRDDDPIAADVTPASLRDPAFRPHGLGLRPGDPPRLFVVDRRPAPPEAGACVVDNAVRLLEPAGDGLRLVRTIEGGDLPIRLNDVEPLDRTRFVATNDHGTRSCLGQNLRDLVGRNGGHLLLHDGEAFRVAARGLPFANGAAFDPERRLLHVAASGDGTIHRYRIDDDGAPVALPAETVALDRSPDNLSIGPDGELLVAAHPDRFHFLFYQRGWFGVDAAPSSILEVAGPTVREVFGDDGAVISAASVAARYRWLEAGIERLLIGQVFGDFLLLCDRPIQEEKAAPDGSGAASQVTGRQGNDGRRGLPGG